MSYPPTECGEVSNNSLFSDSMEFDAAEKPSSGEPIHDGAPNEHEVNGEHDTNSTEHGAPSRDVETPAASNNTRRSSLVKPRSSDPAQPIRWEPVDLQPAEDDADDEFDITSVRRPVYASGEDAKPKVTFLNGSPDLDGEITNCFDSPGLLYRVVDKPHKTWAFYNDSLDLEVRVTCTFGKHSKLEALENTSLTRNADGEYVAEVVVYPTETERFVKGMVNGFTSKLCALQLSDEYYAARSERQWAEVIQPEMEAIRELVGDEQDAEVVLAKCIEHNIPFVDPSFPPVQASIDRGASKPFKQIPWARPRMYLPPELHDQVRLFRGKLVPGNVDQGELGDCWFACALATHVEDPDAVFRMFKHPRGAEHARRERAVGAYRVTFNKNGLWRSVIVDDYLPVVANTPKFGRSYDPAELWPSIVEKAFAKLHHSYAMIQSGDPVHALTDMSGCPSVRFDDAFVEAAASGRGDLFDQWVAHCAAGHRVIITTPGKAPAVTPGSRNTLDFSEEPELEKALAGTGLLPGHAYTILDARSFEKEKQRLVRVRNPWAYGEPWGGDWSPQSELWQRHASIAEALQHDPEADTAEHAIWMSWEDVLRYFNGGGVHLREAAAYDYRLPLTFADCRPGVVLQLHVRAPTKVCLSLANMDHRGMRADEAGAADVDVNNIDYPPIMLSLAVPNEEGDNAGADDGISRVLLNTVADPTQPSSNRWTFLQAREISMMCELEPRHSPYLLIPRLMEVEDTVSGGGNAADDLQRVVDPIYFSNRYDKITPPQSEDLSAKEIPVTLGVRTQTAFDGHDGQGNAVLFKAMSASNAVFENFPKFSTDDVTDVRTDLYFQTRLASNGYAEEKHGVSLA